MTKSTRSGWSAPARVSSTALALVASLALASCAPAADSIPEPVPTRAAVELQVGVLIPVTGSLAAAAPAMRAGVDTAIASVNEATAGVTITAEYRDAGDSSTDTGLSSATELIDLGVNAIVGPLSDGVARKVIAPITQAGIVQISPGTKSPDFARAADDGLYWRTAASCAREGEVLGAQVAADGNMSVAIVQQSDFCGPELAAAAAVAFERGGGKTITQSTFGPGGNSIDAAIAEATAAKPGAVLILAAQSKDAINPLIASGFEGKQLYLSGLGAADFSADFPAGALNRVTTSELGPSISPEFADELRATDPDLTDLSYAAESYDSVILLALAALAAESSSGDAIAAELQAVSGGTSGGKRCESFNACATLILEGKAPDYDGPSGAITFDKFGDAAGATVRLFRFDSTNVSASIDR